MGQAGLDDREAGLDSPGGANVLGVWNPTGIFQGEGDLEVEVW